MLQKRLLARKDSSSHYFCNKVFIEAPLLIYLYLSSMHTSIDNNLQAPFFFQPLFKERIWGGNNIQSHLFPEQKIMPNCGESWVLSSIPGAISEVRRGKENGLSLSALIEKYSTKLMGKKVYQKYGNYCPLLVKFIDTAKDLSIQVHPNDILAKERHNCSGKSELWYILTAEKGAEVISGFQSPMNKLHYEAILQKESNILHTLHSEPAKTGDVFFLPSGRIHNASKGLLFAEIQQCSDITYRIYDFDRTDKKDKKRPLHLQQSVEALDFSPTLEAKTKYKDKDNTAVLLAEEEAFVVYKIYCRKGGLWRDMRKADSFVVYLCVEGEVYWTGDEEEVLLKTGDCVLVAAHLPRYKLHSPHTGTLLEAYVPSVEAIR